MRNSIENIVFYFCFCAAFVGPRPNLQNGLAEFMSRLGLGPTITGNEKQH
jgi:hypothetical protein